jgi:hypothetical protein
MNSQSPSFDEWPVAELLAVLDLPTSALASYTQPVQEQIVHKAQEFASQVNFLLKQAEQNDLARISSDVPNESCMEGTDTFPPIAGLAVRNQANRSLEETTAKTLSTPENRVAELILNGNHRKKPQTPSTRSAVWV